LVIKARPSVEYTIKSFIGVVHFESVIVKVSYLFYCSGYIASTGFGVLAVV